MYIESKVIWVSGKIFCVSDIYYCDDCDAPCSVNTFDLHTDFGILNLARVIKEFEIRDLLNFTPDQNGGAGDDGGAYCSGCVKKHERE